jgi:trimeric autotransporter adhesin
MRFVPALFFASLCLLANAVSALDGSPASSSPPTLSSFPEDMRWWPGFGPRGFNGEVEALIEFNGFLIAAGGFTQFGDRIVNHIARWDGISWSPLGNGTDGNVYTLTVYNGRLIAGGAFTHAGGQSAKRVAAWNGSYWGPLFGGKSAIDDGFVNVLAVYNGLLAAGGQFYSVSGTPTRNIALSDGTRWITLGRGVEGGYSDQVYALETLNGSLIVGGSFDLAGGVSARNIARWDGSTWRPMGTGIGGESPVVWSLNRYGTGVAAGGFFNLAGGVPVTNIALWNGAAWTSLGTAGYVRDLQEFGGELLAAGGTLSRFDGVQWHSFQPQLVTQRLATFSGQLVGDTQAATATGGVRDIAVLSAGTWQRITTAEGHGLTGEITAMESYGGLIVARGQFALPGGIEAAAAWDGANWQAWSLPFVAQPKSIAYHDTVYALGQFTDANGTPIPGGIARWGGTSWLPLGSGGPDMGISALALWGDLLVVGGRFFSGNYGVSGVSTWDGSRWNTYPPGGFGEDPIVALCDYGGNLVVGGAFGITMWDGIAWRTMGEGPGAAVGSTFISALTVFNGELIAGGLIEFPAGAQFSGGIWNGTSWRELGLPMAPRLFKVYNGSLLAAGPQTAGPSVYLWDGASTWSPLGSGVNGSINAVAIQNGVLYVGGNFTAAGHKPSYYVARWDGVTSSVQDAGAAPIARLVGVCPNPCASQGVVTYSLATETWLRISVYDVRGRLVNTLFEGVRPAGTFTASMDGLNRYGRPLPTGVYLCQLAQGRGSRPAGSVQTLKVLLVR